MQGRVAVVEGRAEGLWRLEAAEFSQLAGGDHADIEVGIAGNCLRKGLKTLGRWRAAERLARQHANASRFVGQACHDGLLGNGRWNGSQRAKKLGP